MNDIVIPAARLKFLPDDQNIRVKQIIKQRLLNNQDLIHFLHNTELDENSPDDYFGTNIRFSKNIPETLTVPTNFILILTGTDAVPKQNDQIMYFQVQFLIMVDDRDLIDKETGIERHDLLGAIIRNEFGYTHAFGTECRLIQDRELASDTRFALRELTYEMQMGRDLARTNKNGYTMTTIGRVNP